jgi:hypothetical protein
MSRRTRAALSQQAIPPVAVMPREGAPSQRGVGQPPSANIAREYGAEEASGGIGVIEPEAPLATGAGDEQVTRPVEQRATHGH